MLKLNNKCTTDKPRYSNTLWDTKNMLLNRICYYIEFLGLYRPVTGIHKYRYYLFLLLYEVLLYRGLSVHKNCKLDVLYTDKSNFGSMDQLSQSTQFYFLNSPFNQKSKSVKMCKKFF